LNADADERDDDPENQPERGGFGEERQVFQSYSHEDNANAIEPEDRSSRGRNGGGGAAGGDDPEEDADENAGDGSGDHGAVLGFWSGVPGFPGEISGPSGDGVFRQELRFDGFIGIFGKKSILRVIGREKGVGLI